MLKIETGNEVNRKSTEMSRKKKTVLDNLKKQPARNVRIAVLKNFRKLARVLF